MGGDRRAYPGGSTRVAGGCRTGVGGAIMRRLKGMPRKVASPA